MKFQKIIIPEIMNGLRGNKDLIQRNKKILDSMKLVNDFETDVNDANIASFLDANKQVFSLYICAKKHQESKSTFYLTKSLGDALFKIDKKIPTKYFKAGETIFIVLPDGYMKYRGNNVEGAYVSLYRNNGGLHITIAIVVMQNSKINCAALNMPLTDDHVSDMIDKIINKGDTNESLMMYKLFINAALYINSADNDIMDLKPEIYLNKKQKENQRSACSFQNQCLMPVKLLGWSFHGKTFSKDSTIVSGHFRWQPCGENRSKVKLIYIDEHERNYNDLIDTE